MSEELIQKKLTKNGVIIVNFEYFNLGATTLDQLKQYKIVPNKDFKKYSKRKPDALLVNRQNKDNVEVIVSVEYKKPSEFKTDKQKLEATQQCNDVSQVLDAKIGVITDGQVTIWINPKQPDTQNDYIDKTTGQKRSYSIIRNEDKKDLSEPFQIQHKNEKLFENLDNETKNTLDYIERIISHVTENNSTLIPNEEVDPLGLAKGVWQDIYINTGKEPTKCLYNVVELFIFKFLSDLKVLKKPYSFDALMEMYENGNSNKEVLRHYAVSSRKEIIRLFPKGSDGTTIINGTIFVDENGDPVESQANLFKNSLEKYGAFSSLRNIKKEFKSKLFETFLKQSQDKSRLGQFFTPRKVIKSIIEMADLESLKENSVVCDPFCGVGGFLLEPLLKPKRKSDYAPISTGQINPRVKLIGYDKGMDSDQQRTIILAKANMLIYLSEVLEKNPTLTHEFSKIFNETFHSLSESNLGTLKISNSAENDKFDLILTNPPYITSGVTSIKNEIKSEGLENYYTTGAKGVEGLALEWIIRNLKKNGKAFIIIPDSILNVDQNKGLRNFILAECFVNCIISLPIKTFFNTPKKTYILGLTKKESNNSTQDFPFFSYIVNNIGETLDVNRFEIEGKSDLEKAKDLFNAYKGAPNTFPVDDIGDSRCKLFSIDTLSKERDWMVDRWWTQKEKISLGIKKADNLLSIDGFINKLKETHNLIGESFQELTQENSKKKIDFEKIEIGRILDFPETNSKITKEFCNRHKGTVPVYASSKNEKSTIGYIKNNIKGVKYYNNCLSWNRNGSVGYVFVRDHIFATNEDHRAMTIKDEYTELLEKDYLKFEIENKLFANGFSYLNKCGVDKIKKVEVDIPIVKGKFSTTDQIYLLKKYKKIKEINERLSLAKKEIKSSKVNLLNKDALKEFPVEQIFDPVKGKAQYTKLFIRQNKGAYPVYSSQTTNDGIIGKINTYDFDTPCLTWTTDGIYAGTVFYRNGKFSMTTHCGALLVKESYKKIIDLEYVKHILNNILNDNAVGDGNKRLTVKMIGKIKIGIPVDSSGNIDLKKQKEASDRIKKFNVLKNRIINNLEEVASIKVSVD